MAANIINEPSGFRRLNIELTDNNVTEILNFLAQQTIDDTLQDIHSNEDYILLRHHLPQDWMGMPLDFWLLLLLFTKEDYGVEDEVLHTRLSTAIRNTFISGHPNLTTAYRYRFDVINGVVRLTYLNSFLRMIEWATNRPALEEMAQRFLWAVIFEHYVFYEPLADVFIERVGQQAQMHPEMQFLHIPRPQQLGEVFRSGFTVTHCGNTSRFSTLSLPERLVLMGADRADITLYRRMGVIDVPKSVFWFFNIQNDNYTQFNADAIGANFWSRPLATICLRISRKYEELGPGGPITPQRRQQFERVVSPIMDSLVFRQLFIYKNMAAEKRNDDQLRDLRPLLCGPEEVQFRRFIVRVAMLSILEIGGQI